MRQRKMRFLVTTCRARISGGGTMPDGRKRGYGVGFDVAALREVDAIKRQRNSEKSQLFRVFVYPVIADLAKKKFFGLFGNRCFKCGSTHSLEIDHHIPIVLGGHLVPGNLVALCSRCNNRKLDRPPEAFYSTEELERLQPLLADQSSIFAFSFDRDCWEKDREGYLISLGIERSLVSEVLTNSNHRFYIPPPSDPNERTGVVITLNDDLIKQILEISSPHGGISENQGAEPIIPPDAAR
ncbi:MAG: HNH endonuclease [Gammaproteobacteria bacterium]|nr:MAG: HNH endonuclease [Gammaproteobacteria bacterium]